MKNKNFKYIYSILICYSSEMKDKALRSEKKLHKEGFKTVDNVEWKRSNYIELRKYY